MTHSCGIVALVSCAILCLRSARKLFHALVLAFRVSHLSLGFQIIIFTADSHCAIYSGDHRIRGKIKLQLRSQTSWDEAFFHQLLTV